MKHINKVVYAVVAASMLLSSTSTALDLKTTAQIESTPVVKQSTDDSSTWNELLKYKNKVFSIADDNLKLEPRTSTVSSSGSSVSLPSPKNNSSISTTSNSSTLAVSNTSTINVTSSSNSSSIASAKQEAPATTVAPAANPAPPPVTVTTPAPPPAPPSIPTSSKLILGYGTYYYSGDSSSYNSLTAHSSLINELATHTYIVDTTGGIYIQGNGPFPTIQVSYANNHGIKTLAVVRNEFSASVATSVLNNSSYRSNLINSILNALRTNGFKGVNIDFEMLKSTDRDAYTSFMKELYNTIHPQGYIVSIALPAKTYDSAKAYWTYAYDYVSLGNYSDQVILMTYDEHYPGGTPGPVASINWVQQVVNYAVSVIPRSKLLLGLAAYGYDWPANGGSTISYSIAAANSTASKYGVQIQWDSTAQVPFYNYTASNGVNHSVYFENSTSIGYKLNIVNNSNLLGAAIWRLGLEDEPYWTSIRTKLNK